MVRNTNVSFLIFLTLLSLVALVFAIISFWNVSDVDKKVPEGKWVCSAVQCAEQYTREEWIKDFCTLNENNTFMCRVVFNGQEVQVPLNALNLTNLQACKVWTCTQEMFVRDANYTLQVQQ